jgi:lipoprotein-anchoring transpeptidase ErfK/SrfK
MRKLLALGAFVLLGFAALPVTAAQILPNENGPAVQDQPRIVARVSISRQRMEVFHEGRKIHDWPVSTARPGKITPIGQWKGAQWLSRDHRSSLYNNAPMPYAIFYHGNYAIHGTDQVKKLGRPASAGCVRLHTANARILFNMVRAEGKQNLRVVVER